MKLAYKLILPVMVLLTGALRAFENIEASVVWVFLAISIWFLTIAYDEIAFLKARVAAKDIELAKFYRQKEQ